MNTNIKSAVVSMILTAIIAVAMYIIGIGDIFIIDGRILLNIAVMSLLTGLVSIIKSSGTDNGGYFAGVKVKN